MKKLTFKQLEDSQEVIHPLQQSLVLGGGGGITGGTGTSGDPYIITANYYTNGTLAGASDAAGQFYGGTTEVGGQHYAYNVNVIAKGSQQEADDAAYSDVYTTPDGRDIRLGNVIKTGSLGQNANGYEVWGTADEDNVITYDPNKMDSKFSGAEANRGSGFSGDSGISEASFMSNVLAHEMGHTLGLDDNTGGVMNSGNEIKSGDNIVGYENFVLDAGNNTAVVSSISTAPVGGINGGNHVYR